MAHACSPSYSGGWGRGIAWIQETEVAVSWDHATALQPGDKARLHLKKKIRKQKQNIYMPGVVAQACNHNTLGGWGRWITWSQEFRASLNSFSVSTKNTKISWAWWCVPVIPATFGRLRQKNHLNLEGWRLQWAEIAPLHSSLGNKSETPSQKKKRKKEMITKTLFLRIKIGMFNWAIIKLNYYLFVFNRLSITFETILIHANLHDFAKRISAH